MGPEDDDVSMPTHEREGSLATSQTSSVPAAGTADRDGSVIAQSVAHQEVKGLFGFGETPK